MKIGQIDITDNQLFFVKYSHCRLISFPQEIDRSPTYSFNDLIKIELFCGEKYFFFVFDHKSPFILLELTFLIMWPLNSFDHYSLNQILLPIVAHFIKKLPKSSMLVIKSQLLLQLYFDFVWFDPEFSKSNLKCAKALYLNTSCFLNT